MRPHLQRKAREVKRDPSPVVGRVFSRCIACTHAAAVRVASPCGLCGGEMRASGPPRDLFSEWRCACRHCASTPC